jgi:hypothetical protein
VKRTIIAAFPCKLTNTSFFSSLFPWKNNSNDWIDSFQPPPGQSYPFSRQASLRSLSRDALWSSARFLISNWK